MSILTSYLANLHKENGVVLPLLCLVQCSQQHGRGGGGAPGRLVGQAWRPRPQAGNKSSCVDSACLLSVLSAHGPTPHFWEGEISEWVVPGLCWGDSSSRGPLLGEWGPSPCGRSPRWHSAWRLALMGYQCSECLRTPGPGRQCLYERERKLEGASGPTPGSVGAGLCFTLRVGKHFI